MNVKSIERKINTYVQTIGILIASYMAVYAFYYKELWLPKSAPTPLRLTVDARSAGNANDTKYTNSRAVEIQFTAVNLSPRKVGFLPNAFTVNGVMLVAPEDKSPDVFKARGTNALNSESYSLEEKYAIANGHPELVAVGRIFRDRFLNPGESVTRSIVVHFPQKTYDVLDVRAEVASTAAEHKDMVNLKWKLQDDLELTNSVSIRRGSGCYPLDCDREGHYPGMPMKYEFQHVGCRLQVSLWDLPRTDARR